MYYVLIIDFKTMYNIQVSLTIFETFKNFEYFKYLISIK